MLTAGYLTGGGMHPATFPSTMISANRLASSQPIKV